MALDDAAIEFDIPKNALKRAIIRGEIKTKLDLNGNHDIDPAEIQRWKDARTLQETRNETR